MRDSSGGGRAGVRLFMTTAILLSTLVAGCGEDPAPQEEAMPRDPVALALEAASRPGGDRERDATRRPQEILSFFGVAPGMTVLDVFSGGGYYTEILARIVGPTGSVIAHNNQAYLDYAADEIAARYGGGRLGNVTRLNGPVTGISVEPATVDIALLILAYHDIYFRPEDGSWPEIDGRAMLDRIRDSLKPGGILGVVDHAGNPDITIEEIGRLHRISEERLLREVRAAGFELVGSSDVLRNTADDHVLPMYDARIRGRTDRLVLKFRKPTADAEEDPAS